MAVISKKARKTVSSPLLEAYLSAKSRGEKYTGGKASEPTVTTYRNQLQRLEDYAKKPLHELTATDVHDAVETSIAQDLSPSYRNLMLSAGRGFFDWAIQNGKPIACSSNPFAGIRVSKRVAEDGAKGITESQFKTIIKAIETIDEENVRRAKITGPKAYNLPWVQDPARLQKKTLPLKLMFYGGLRTTEAVSLKIDNIDENGIIVNGSRGTSGERYVPLPRGLISELKTYVRRHSEDEVYVFTPVKTSRYKKGTHLDATRAYQPFEEGVERAGLPEWVTPFSLRHSYGFQAMRRTQRLEVVKELLGFESIERALIYAPDEASSPFLDSLSVWE